MIASIKNRLLTGWSIQRAMYLGMGLLIIVSSIADGMLLGVVGGSWFAAMGLFGFGCAGGACRR